MLLINIIIGFNVINIVNIVNMVNVIIRYTLIDKICE